MNKNSSDEQSLVLVNSGLKSIISSKSNYSYILELYPYCCIVLNESYNVIYKNKKTEIFLKPKDLKDILIKVVGKLDE